MKLFFFTLFLFPFLVSAQSTNFIVNDSRVVEENPGDNPAGLSSGSQSEYQDAEQGSEIGDTGSFQTTQQGGLDGTTGLQSSGQGVQLLGLAQGAMFASMCGPHNAMACVAAGLSFADAMAGGSAANAAYQKGTYIDPTAGYDGEAGGTDPLIDQQIQDGIQNLAESGYTLSDGGVVGPDGQTYSAEDLQSVEAMVAKGATPAQAAQFQDQLARVQAEAAEKVGVEVPQEGEGQAVATSGAGFGGGDTSGGATRGADTYIEEIEYRGKKKEQKRGIAEAAASKLSKNFNGEPIGIGMGNLFLIVHQKYKTEKSKKRFFNKEIVSKGK